MIVRFVNRKNAYRSIKNRKKLRNSNIQQYKKLLYNRKLMSGVSAGFKQIVQVKKT